MKIDCSICGAKKSMNVITRTENIPYFGEIMESVMACGSCNYKHTDVICLEQKDSIRYSLIITTDTLNARVVKSQSATITIPALGLKVEPGSKSLGYISNIEGVVDRFQEAVKTAMNLIDEEESKKNGEILLNKLKDVRNGDLVVELIMEDPFGQSVISHSNANKRKLSDDEIKNLKTGFINIDKEDIK